LPDEEQAQPHGPGGCHHRQDQIGKESERDGASDEDRDNVAGDEYREAGRDTPGVTANGMRAPVAKRRAPLQSGVR
jgi:hypothetical protein